MRSNSIRRSDRVDEAIHEGVLDDGLPVHVIPRTGYQKKFAILTTDYGSVDTEFVPPGGGARQRSPEGVAHFLEHKLFEDEAGDAFDQFARFGASANAYTSYTETAYHFTTSTQFYECLDLLLDFVNNPYFTTEQIEKERKVIAQEIRMYEDSPDSRAHLNLMRSLYQDHPVRIDIPGTTESIEDIDKAHLELCHRSFYRPENMLLVVAGDLDPSEVFDRAGQNAARRLSRHGPAAQGELGRVEVDEPAAVAQRRVDDQMPVSHPKALIGTKDRPVARGPLLARSLREAGFALELVFGRSAAFFEEHCATGLIDDTFSYSYHAGRGGFAYLVVGGDTPDPDGLVNAVNEAVKTAVFDPEDFARLRNKAWGRFMRSFNSLEGTACGEADSRLQGWDLLRYLEILESIELKDLQARLPTLFEPERQAVSVMRPL